jgi:hypothetical protein
MYIYIYIYILNRTMHRVTAKGVKSRSPNGASHPKSHYMGINENKLNNDVENGFKIDAEGRDTANFEGDLEEIQPADDKKGITIHIYIHMYIYLSSSLHPLIPPL